MFSTDSSQPLVLEINGNRYEFASPNDFAFALSGRAGVPGTKITSLVKLSTVALRREAEAIRHIEQMFNDALDGSMTDVTSIGPFLREIDLNSISQDHDWRALMMSLNQTDRAFEEFKKIALVKYVQYLAARREAIAAIYTDRQTSKSIDTGTEADDPDGRVRETAIFNVGELDHRDPGEFSRMPKGETLEVALPEVEELNLLVAKHPCRLRHGDKPIFVDDAGQETRLHRGRNIIGRDANSDVVIDPHYRDVSRKHLIIEVENGGIAKLTDISSHGTSVPPDFLDNTSI